MFQMINFEKKWNNLMLKLSVDSSFMKAYLEQTPAGDESDTENLKLRTEDIYDFLNDHGIIYGIDQMALTNFTENMPMNKTILIAKGDKQTCVFSLICNYPFCQTVLIRYFLLSLSLVQFFWEIIYRFIKSSFVVFNYPLFVNYFT